MLNKNLTSIIIFSNLVETMNFTDTAKILKISKSTVSREIAELELLVGAKLINRTTRKIEITEFGFHLYSFCKDISQQLQKTVNYINFFNSQIVGKLSVYAPVSFGNKYIVPILNKLLDENIHFEVCLELSDVNIKFNESPYDIAITITSNKPSHNYCNCIGSIEMGLYCSPLFFDTLKTIKSPLELPKYGYILYFGRIRTKYLPFYKNKEKIKIDVFSRFRSNNTYSLLEMALDSKGIAYLPDYIAIKYVTENKLIKILPDWKMDSFSIWYLYKNNANMIKEVSLLSDYLKKEISNLNEFK